MTSIGTNSFYDRSIGSMTLLRSRAESLQNQIATEERLQRASDDPSATRQLRMLARDDVLAAVRENNAAVATADFSLADDAISQLTSLVIRAQELATQAANGTVSDLQRKLNGDELAQIHESMVAILNNKDSSGHPLFAGTADGPAYVVAADGSASYSGTTQVGEIEVGEGISVPRTLTGPDILTISVDGATTDLLTVIHGLAVSLQSTSPASAADANAALKGLAAGLSSLSTGQAVIGARQARIELATAVAEDRGEVRASEQIRLGATDMPAAIAELQQTMTILEASQASFAKLASLSLFEFLR